ncbi:MAG TPA: tetratricopeptide repeat protein, partial [Kofleriaceae bacterium]
VASEAEALLVGDDTDGRLADLNVRTALASWDGLHEPEEAMRYLELAENHPLAPRLHLSAALGQRAPEPLAIVQLRVSGLPAGEMKAALAVELAEAWLFRYARAEQAAAMCDLVLADPLPAGWKPHVAHLASLVYAAIGKWDRVVTVRRDALTPTSSFEETAAAAALVLDRERDAPAALSLCWEAIERMDRTEAGDTQPSINISRAGALRVIDVAIDAAARANDPRMLELLDRRGELVTALPGGALESLATRHAVAAALTRDGQHGEAAALWAQLADDATATQTTAGRRIATLSQAWAAAAAGDQKSELAARRRLATMDGGECVEVAESHAWRALELAAATAATPKELSDLAHAVVSASDSSSAEWWLDLIDYTLPTQGTIARLEQRGGLALRWAAILAEKLDNPSRALDLWRKAAHLDARLGCEYDHVVRLLRGSDEDELADAYLLWALAEKDPRCASALQCARGIVDLVRGDFVEAEETLQRAADLDPKDPFCRAALAAVYRAGKRFDQLAQVLAELSTSLTSRDARASAAREYAQLLDEHLGDPTAARKALERMISERPDDDDTMLVLAKLYDRDQNWAASIELRKKAVALAQQPERKAEVWMDIAVREERRGDRNAALAALDKALETKARRADVLREQARIHRLAGNHEKALAIVKEELTADPPLARRMQLQTDLAVLLTALDREPQTVVNAYLDVLSIEPDQTEALAGIEAPARKLGLWDELARAFRGAPSTPKNLEILAEALEKIAEWSELAEVRRRQLEAATTNEEKAKRAAALAKLYESELGDSDAAIRMLQTAQAAVHDPARQQDLLRLLRVAERWGDMAQALERELGQVRDTGNRHVELLLELGELRADKLNRLPEAVLAFEAVLDRDEKNQ